jgi:SAM-dependent methyltransferase
MEPATRNFDAFARYYDADMGSYADDLLLYRELARRADGPVLDAMCGTGRVIVPLAEAGFETVGLDISAAMIDVVTRKAAERGLGDRLRAVQGDVRAFDLSLRFGLIVVPLNSFMHLETVGDQLAALRAMTRHLLPDGRLVLDLFNPDPRDLMHDQGVLVHERDFAINGRVVQKYVIRRTDWAAQRQDVTFVYDELAPDGVVTRRALPFVMRWLYRYEVQHLLARVGLSVDAIYGDYDLAPYGGDSPQLLVIARQA